MTLQGWREQMTAKGITHNDAVRLLKDAEAEIERLCSALRLIAAHTADPGTAFETVVKFAAATLGETS